MRSEHACLSFQKYTHAPHTTCFTCYCMNDRGRKQIQTYDNEADDIYEIMIMIG